MRKHESGKMSTLAVEPPRGLFRWRYLVRARRGINVQAFIRAWLAEVKPKGSVRLAIDVDPYSFL